MNAYSENENDQNHFDFDNHNDDYNPNPAKIEEENNCDTYNFYPDSGF